MTTRLDLAQFAGFTPGEWRVGINPGPMVYSAGGVQVADCRFDNGGANRNDARLIAAAPALLTECLRQREEIERLRGALRFACDEMDPAANFKPRDKNAALNRARAALAASGDA